MEGEGPEARAVGARLADGRVFRGRTVVSNATRWDTFDGLLPPERLPEPERLFRCSPACSPVCTRIAVCFSRCPPGSWCVQAALRQGARCCPRRAWPLCLPLYLVCGQCHAKAVPVVKRQVRASTVTFVMCCSGSAAPRRPMSFSSHMRELHLHRHCLCVIWAALHQKCTRPCAYLWAWPRRAGSGHCAITPAPPGVVHAFHLLHALSVSCGAGSATPRRPRSCPSTWAWRRPRWPPVPSATTSAWTPGRTWRRRWAPSSSASPRCWTLGWRRRVPTSFTFLRLTG